HEPATHNPGSPAAPGPEEAAAAPHDPAAFAAEAAPEPAAHDPDLGADDPGLAAHDQDLGADDLEPTAHDAEPVAPEHYEPVAQDTDDPDPPAGHTDEQPPAEDAAGYPIPGLPASPEPAPREALPEPPPRLRASDAAPMRRAFRRDGPGAGGAGAAAGLASDGRDARGSRRRSRWIAVLALLVIGVVVALLVYGLSRSSDHTTAKAPPVVKVLIPEGKTRLQIAQIAQAAGLKGSYRVAARSSPLLNPTQYGAPHGTSTLEGFLFPATYDMDKGAPSSRLVEEQLQAFQENFSSE